MSIRKAIIISILLIISTGNVYSRSGVDSSEYANLKKAAVLYTAKDYKQSARLLTELKNSKNTEIKTSALLLLAKISFEPGTITPEINPETIDTTGLSRSLRKEIYFVRSDYHYRKSRFDKSLQTLLTTFNYLEQREDTVAFYNNLEALIVYFLDEKSVNAVIEKNSITPVWSYLKLAYSVKLKANGNNPKAHEQLLEILTGTQSGYAREKAVETLEQLKEIFGGDAEKSQGLIAVVLPLTDAETDDEVQAGVQVLDGIKFAVDEYNTAQDENIGLIIFDTKGENSELIRIAGELKSLESLRVIIGSLYSTETNTLCYLLHDLNIPVISPTATGDSLTFFHSNFFQANPSFSVRGEAMAQYLVYTEGKKRIAVVYQDQSFGAPMAFSFRKEFERLGGKVTAFEAVTPSGNEIQTITANFATQGWQGAEGLFFPLMDKKLITMLNSAFQKAQLKIPVYGNQDWYSLRDLQLNSSLVENLVVSSDYYIEYTQPAYLDFSKKFYEKTGLEPLRNHFYGYDLLSGLLPVIAKSESNLSDVLKKEVDVPGFHNSLRFGDTRMNRYMNFFRYRNGEFKLMDRFRVGR